MKIIKINGLKIEVKNLDYNFIEQEMIKLQKKGKNEKAEAYAHLLSKLNKDSSPEEIQKIVNELICENKEKIKKLQQEIKAIDKETTALAAFSNKEIDSSDSVINTIINSL